MRLRIRTILAAAALAFVTARIALPHCQIPCGIYGDDTRFDLMLEHVATIEKSMKQIEGLQKGEQPNGNQLVRWVENKEAHAGELAQIVTAYFMAQRVKPVSSEEKVAYQRYVQQVTLLHQILVRAMKAKQTTDPAHCSGLRELIAEFKKSYTEK